MKVWLDDIRDPKKFSFVERWTWVKTAQEAIALLEKKKVTLISLDHDLGDEALVGSGYQVAKWIEEAAYFNKIPKLDWRVHSQNSVGRNNIIHALEKAEKYWKSNLKHSS